MFLSYQTNRHIYILYLINFLWETTNVRGLKNPPNFVTENAETELEKKSQEFVKCKNSNI